jgi:hypothetical protein
MDGAFGIVALTNADFIAGYSDSGSLNKVSRVTANGILGRKNREQRWQGLGQKPLAEADETAFALSSARLGEAFARGSLSPRREV